MVGRNFIVVIVLVLICVASKDLSELLYSETQIEISTTPVLLDQVISVLLMIELPLNALLDQTPCLSQPPLLFQASTHLNL